MIPSTPTVPPSNESASRVRRVYSPQEKTDLLALFAESGLTAADFCREMDVPPATFSFWRRQGEIGADASAPIEFAEVRVTPPVVATTVVTITTPGGATLSVPAGTDPVWVGQLLQNLR